MPTLKHYTIRLPDPTLDYINRQMQHERKLGKTPAPLSFWLRDLLNRGIAAQQSDAIRQARLEAIRRRRADPLREIHIRRMDAGFARITLTTLNERHARGMADPKQIRLLERECYGFKHAALLTRGEAGKIIGRIKANGFRMPPALEPERDKWNRLHR